MKNTTREAIYSHNEVKDMLDGKRVEPREWQAPEKYNADKACPHCNGSAFKTIAVNFKTVRVECPHCSGTGEL